MRIEARPSEMLVLQGCWLDRIRSQDIGARIFALQHVAPIAVTVFARPKRAERALGMGVCHSGAKPLPGCYSWEPVKILN